MDGGNVEAVAGAEAETGAGAGAGAGAEAEAEEPRYAPRMVIRGRLCDRLNRK